MDTIVIFTSNFRGGILQFTMQLASIIESLRFKVVVYVPYNSKIEMGSYPVNIVRFHRENNILAISKLTFGLAKDIERISPSLVVFADATIISSMVLLSLNAHLPRALFIHDVIPHIQRFNMYENLKQMLERTVLKRVLTKTDRIILLSDNSLTQFKARFPDHFHKATMIPLGAHVPVAKSIAPPEFDGLDLHNYYLFFGRIGKYKGIIRLLRAYQALTVEKPSLVIAGSGELQPEEKKIAVSNQNVILINRYIEDGEMLYLINNALTVVLPYIEATQSGVLPIAYYHKVPVIASNIAGLIEFVRDGVTGMLFDDDQQLSNALIRICNLEYRNYLGDGAHKFYQEHLNWSNILMECIEPLVRRY